MKVLITGSGGRIGQVLVHGLAHDVTEFDLPECDARSLDQLADAVRGHNALVHLAWNTETENAYNDAIDGDNARMALNAYQAALRSGVRRVLVASSVHVDQWSSEGEELLLASAIPTPASPYGASKVFVEALGRHFAWRGLEVVAVRFGGVDGRASTRDFGNDNRPDPVWLSHADCVALVDACLTAVEVPGRYAAFYAVSEDGGRIHDVTNPFGWRPQPPGAASAQRLRSTRWLPAIASRQVAGGSERGRTARDATDLA